MSLYESKSYKESIKKSLKENKQKYYGKYSYDKMAEACKVQKSYLSRVLNSESSHLNEEQLELICQFLKISKEEREFLQLLRRYEKCVDPSVKDDWLRDIERLKSENLQTKNHIQAQISHTLSPHATAYFLNPMNMIVHMFLTTRKFRNNLDLLAETLSLSEEKLGKILQRLEKWGILELSDTGKIKILQENIHLEPDSALYSSYRSLQRLNTLSRLDHLSSKEAYSFSAIFASDESTRNKIKKDILKLIGEAQAQTATSRKEGVYQLNIDLFNWS